MTVETHEVVFSFDQPGDTRNPLLSILQQLLNRPVERNSRAGALLGSQKVLIVDSQQERAQYIAHLLSSVGYRPFVAPTSLDAYTLFLQGTFHPFVIILNEEGAANNQFFLTRLSQQFVQRYDWNVPFIRLQVPPSHLFGPRTTGPLANSSRTTLPLSSSGGEQMRRVPPSSPLPQRPRMPVSRPGEQMNRAPFQSSPGFQPSSTFPPSSVFPRPPAPLSPQAEPPIPRPRPSSAPLRTQPPPPMRSSIPATSALPDIQGPVPQVARRRVVPLPSASTMKFTKKQVEKISLDGLSIGRYQLKSIIGGNPIGDVYVTYDRLREQDIALKTLQTNMIPFHLMEGLEEDYNLFQQELDLLQQVEHPHISRVMNIGKSYISGFPFIYKTMPHYVEGSLGKWLSQFTGRIFTPAEVARVIWQLADALQFLHERGMLYQNFKLTNVLVVNATENMRDLHVVLSDLPFVRDVINLPKTIESYRYFAPEQWEGESFTSSDQYGLAIMAYELLTGRAPFQGNSDAIMRRMHLTMPAPAPSSVNRQIYPFIDKVILRALSKRPEERFESIAAFATALERASN
ncbi:MAG TPA: protein kinase [Ktedonobacteraceae bacterium]|nr:protein kinase [Ktedonobacteraceae bacterium]